MTFHKIAIQEQKTISKGFLKKTLTWEYTLYSFEVRPSILTSTACVGTHAVLCWQKKGSVVSPILLFGYCRNFHDCQRGNESKLETWSPFVTVDFVLVQKSLVIRRHLFISVVLCMQIYSFIKRAIACVDLYWNLLYEKHHTAGTKTQRQMDKFPSK